MDLKWLTHKFIDELNDFLTFEKNDFKYEVIESNIYSNKNINMQLGYLKNFNKNEISPQYNRDIIRMFTSWFPKLEELNSSVNNFYVYSPIANTFKDFRISNFNVMLNDKKELEWFDKYIKPSNSGIDLSKSWRREGHMLVKCATTTLNNEEYMVANYNIKNLNNRHVTYCKPIDGYSQYSAIYNAEPILDKFDSLYSSNLKPISGFVRYGNKEAEAAFKFLLSLPKHLFQFAYSLMSTFVKGECMKEEQEFRFLILSTSKNIKEITIFEEPKLKETYYSEKDLEEKINEYYKNDCSQNKVECE